MTTRPFDQERTETFAERPVDPPNGGPRPLPYCAYPKAGDVDHHGVQPLPASLPLADFARAQPHRSNRYSTVDATELSMEQLLQVAWVIAASFVRREP